MCMIVGGEGLNIVVDFQQLPSECFRIKLELEKIDSISDGKDMDERPAVVDRVMEADFGNRVAPAAPIERSRGDCAPDVVG